MQHAVGNGLADRVVHQRQAGAAAGKDLRRLAAEHIGKILAGTGQAGKLAVVAGVNALVHAGVGVAEDGQQLG